MKMSYCSNYKKQLCQCCFHFCVHNPILDILFYLRPVGVVWRGVYVFLSCFSWTGHFLLNMDEVLQVYSHHFKPPHTLHIQEWAFDSTVMKTPLPSFSKLSEDIDLLFPVCRYVIYPPPFQSVSPIPPFLIVKVSIYWIWIIGHFKGFYNGKSLCTRSSPAP